MTLRFIVARILRELIELAECDGDAELVAALHDALDVASPAGQAANEGLVVRVRGVAGWERSGGAAERQVGAGRDRDRCSGRMLPEKSLARARSRPVVHLQYASDPFRASFSCR